MPLQPLTWRARAQHHHACPPAVLCPRPAHPQTAYQALVQAVTEGATPTAYAPDDVAAALLPSFLARYTAGGEPNITAAQANASAAAAQRVQAPLTDASLGLMWFDPKNADGSVTMPARAAIALNGWAVWMVQQAAAGDGAKVGL